YKNRPKPNINPPDDNSKQSVDEPYETSEYTTKEDNISATEALIKFMKLVLTEIGGDNFRDFPDS
ncbi:12177_t:CDS:2, partial [Funneliformis geosporum]